MYLIMAAEKYFYNIALCWRFTALIHANILIIKRQPIISLMHTSLTTTRNRFSYRLNNVSWGAAAERQRKKKVYCFLSSIFPRRWQLTLSSIIQKQSRAVNPRVSQQLCHSDRSKGEADLDRIRSRWYGSTSFSKQNPSENCKIPRNTTSQSTCHGQGEDTGVALNAKIAIRRTY